MSDTAPRLIESAPPGSCVYKGADYYTEDYYRRGQSCGVSLYEDYRWMPETTLRLAMALIDLAAIPREQPILDYGCARGYLVKAFRLLFRDAYGMDHSQWAVENADPVVHDYIRLVREGYRWPLDTMTFHTIVAKDVMEHLRPDQVNPLLQRFRVKGQQLVVIVPLGDGEHFTIPYMEEEPDHTLRHPLWWWREQCERARWVIQVATNRVEGIKDQWRDYPNGHGILYAR